MPRSSFSPGAEKNVYQRIAALERQVTGLRTGAIFARDRLAEDIVTGAVAVPGSGGDGGAEYEAVPFPLNPGWTANGTNAGLFRVGGIALLTGDFSWSTGSPPASGIGTIPAALRPFANQSFPAYGTGNITGTGNAWKGLARVEVGWSGPVSGGEAIRGDTGFTGGISVSRVSFSIFWPINPNP